MRVPFGATEGGTLKSDGLSFVVVKVTLCPASSGGPAEMLVTQLATVCGPESSSVVCVAPSWKVGGSLTGAMVIVAVLSFVPPRPSSARKTKLSPPL